MTDAEFLRETDSLVPKSPVIAEFHARLTAAVDQLIMVNTSSAKCPVCEADLTVDSDSEVDVLVIIG